MTNGLVQHVTVEESTSIQWVKSKHLSEGFLHPAKQTGSKKYCLPLDDRKAGWGPHTSKNQQSQ